MDFLRASTGEEENSSVTDKTGFLPEVGKFSVFRWAEFFGVSEPTFRRWIAKYKIPTRKPGAVMIVDAQEFWSRIPYLDPVEEAEETD